MIQLSGMVALITGASEGIGAECARVFRDRGVKLALNSRSIGKEPAYGGTDTLLFPGDITDSDVRRRLVQATVDQFGRIDILVNCVGVGLYAPAHRAPLEETRRMFELNFFAPLALTQLVVSHMKAQRRGTIVNVSSIAGKVTLPWFTLYSASKYALGSLGDGLRMELARDGIRVLNVCPGYVETRFQEHVLAGRPPKMIRDAKQFAITAAQCAEALVRGVERGARTVVVPRSGWAFIILERLLPSLVDYQLSRMLYHAEQQQA